jgi:hypothetical protein
MPKVASASITEAVRSNALVLPHSLKPKTVRFFLKHKSDSLRFTFVRNPYQRFVSAYKWAIRNIEDTKVYALDIPQKKIVEDCGDINGFCKRLPGLLEDKENHLIHFYPQAEFISSGNKMLVDYVGKYEEMELSCQELREKHGYELNITFGNNPKNVLKTQTEGGLESLDSKSIEVLSELYHKDFEIFGYHKFPTD